MRVRATAVTTADSWTNRALPLLRFVAEHEDVRSPGESLGGIAEQLGLTATQVDVELDRLSRGEYVKCNLIKMPYSPEGSILYSAHLLERGARTIGAWPAADPYEDVIALLAERMCDETLPAETRGRLRRMHDTLIDVGKGVAGELLAALVSRQIGLG